MTITKPCRYGCGAQLEWRQTNEETKGKFYETGTNIWHSFPRCKELLTKQGKEATFDIGWKRK